MTVEYWLIFSYGSPWSSICSKHKSYQAALRAARRCEKAGGAFHRIAKIQYVRKAAT